MRSTRQRGSDQGEREAMSRESTRALPEFSPERFADRLAEAVELGKQPEKLAQYPAWTRRVMRILQDQLVPPEFAAMLAADQAIFCEGVCVAWMAQAREIVQRADSRDGDFARKVLAHLTSTRAQGQQELYARAGTGELAMAPEFQQHVMARLFAREARERQAFAEGLATGHRVRELFDRRAAEHATDATGIYLLLWLYWPEIAQMRSLGEAGRSLERLFASSNPNIAGRHWEERFRKLANRIGLSFRTKQLRQKRRSRRD